MQIIVVYFLYHVCPKKAIAQEVLKIMHYKITSFHLYKRKTVISKQINKK